MEQLGAAWSSLEQLGAAWSSLEQRRSLEQLGARGETKLLRLLPKTTKHEGKDSVTSTKWGRRIKKQALKELKGMTATKKCMQLKEMKRKQTSYENTSGLASDTPLHVAKNRKR